MCGPLAASAGAMALGSLMQSKAQSDQRNSMQDAQVDDARRRTQIQEGYQKQQDALSSQAQAKVAATATQIGASGTQAAIDAAAAKRDGAYNAVNGPVANDTLAGVQDAPTMVKDQLGAKLAGALTTLKAVGAARAKQGGFGDAMVGNQNNLADTGNAVNMFGNFRQGLSQQVLPTQLAASDATYNADMANAQNSGRGIGTLGSLLSTAGSLYGQGTAAGAFGGAGGTSGWTSWLNQSPGPLGKSFSGLGA